MPSQVDVLLTAQEVAERLKIKLGTVRSWTSRGSIGSIKIGKSLVRYRLADIEGLVRERPPIAGEAAAGR
jgi:excisionase family DNA binding protein